MRRTLTPLFASLLACLVMAPAACRTGSDANTTGTVTQPITQDGNGAQGGGNETPAAQGNTVANANVVDPNVDTTPIPVPVCTTNTAVDINVVVTTSKGPNGFSSPIAITNDLYSMGIDDQTRQDFVPSPNAKFVAFLKGLKPGMLRFPAGVNGQKYRWSATDNPKSTTTMSPGFIDQFMALVKAAESNAYLAINIESGTIDDATNFITYVNKTKNYGVKWWQLGNEPSMTGPNFMPEYYNASNSLQPYFSVYNNKYLQYRNALLSVDPTIKTVGLEVHSGMDIGGGVAGVNTPNDRGEPDWFTPFMAAVGNQVDALAFHYYPLYSGDGSANNGTSSTVPSVAHLLAEDATDWPPSALNFADKVMPTARATLSKVAPNAKVWVDEFGEDSGNILAAKGYGDTFVGALWAADAMARYADQGVGAIFHFIFKAEHLDSDLKFYYTLLDPNNDPRPEYYAIWLMANHYGDRVVATTTSAISQVASHAALRSSDGSLRVLLVNKSTSAKQVRLQLPDFKPVRARQYNVVGTAMQGTDVSINGNQLTQSNVTLGDAAVAANVAQACTDNVFTVPALSVNIVVFTTK